MNQNFEMKGYWFLPGQPDNKVAGILYFERHKEIHLELIGGFDSNDLFFNSPVNIILGVGNNAEKITLINCYGYGSKNFSCEFPITFYKCQYIINGKHLLNIEEKVFNKIVVDLSTLYDWLPFRAIQTKINRPDNKIIETSFVMSELNAWERIVEINNEYTLKLFTDYGYHSPYNKKMIELYQNILCEISCRRGKRSFVELLNFMSLFKHLLSLISMNSTNYLQIKLYDDDEFQEISNGNRIFNSTECLYIERDPLSSIDSWNKYLFDYSDIENQFSEMIKKWYSNANSLAPIRSNLITSIAPKVVFTNSDFLIIVQALEGYYRRFINSDSTIKLRKRLEDIILINKEVVTTKNISIDLDKVVKSRNYYSHLFERNENVLDGIELFEETKQLRILLIACVLNIIGFEKEQIHELIKKNSEL